jgi:branched-chain amino acid transport system permease protein
VRPSLAHVRIAAAPVALAAIWALPGLVDRSRLQSLILVAIFASAVASINVVFGYTGQLTLGQTGFMAIGAYATAIGTTRWDWSPIVALLVGVVVSGAAAFPLGLVVFRLSGLYFAIATLGFALAVESVLQGWSDFTGGPSGVLGISRFEIAGLDLSEPAARFRVAVVLVCLALLFTRQVLRSREGTAMQAVSVDVRIAASFGANPLRVKLGAFAVGAMIASASGSLYAHELSVAVPDLFNIELAVRLLVMGFLGGIGTLAGPVVGAAMELTRELYADAREWVGIIEGAILAAVILFMPRGIVGSIRPLWRWLRPSLLRSGRGSGVAEPAEPAVVPGELR